MPNKNDHNNNYFQIEEKIINKESIKKHEKMKVSGKSVFKLQNIIRRKKND